MAVEMAVMAQVLELPFIKEFLELSLPEILIFAIFIISITLVVGLSGFRFYTRIRHSIPVKVNCWFCNEDTKVPYLSREGWSCPGCQQYNGFNEDGGYNKRIPAQFIQALNRPVLGVRGGNGLNGGCQNPGMQLCEECNLNLELKYFQLAQYVPMEEDKYDEEIEAEQRRLDQVYDICTSCKLIVGQVLKGKGQSVASTSSVPREPIVERPRRPNTPAPTPSPGRNNQGQRQQLLSGLPQEDGDLLFDAKLNQLHISASGNKSRSSPSSIFGGSNTSRVVNTGRGSPCPSTLHGSTTGHYQTQPFTPSPPPSGYFNGKPGLGPEFYKSWQNNQQPLYSPYNNSLNNINAYQYTNTAAYHYRSSSVASVFGGRKPLLSPSKLAGSMSLHVRRQQQQDLDCSSATEFRHYNHVCYCPQQQGLSTYGAYGIVYGTSMPISSPNGFMSPTSEQLNNISYSQPISKSSSQSSGFVSGSPTPPSTSRFSTTPNTGSQDDEPLFISGPTFTPPSRRSDQELRRRSHFASQSSMESPYFNESRSNHNVKVSGQQKQCHCNSKARSRKYRVKKEVQPKREENPDSMFSDDDSDPEVSVSTTDRSNVFNKYVKGTANYVATVFSPKYLFQLFIRGFLFINVLLVFCICFVGKWPEPMQAIINIGTNFYEQLFEYASPLILLFEKCVNTVLSFIIPDAADDIVNDEAVERILFE